VGPARRGGPTPRPADADERTWVAAACIAEGLPLATLNIKDYEGFVEHHGLVLVGH
jgi:toxin FitB